MLSCNFNKPLTKRYVYLNSTIVEGMDVSEGKNIIYKYYEKEKNGDKTFIVIQVKDSTILKKGNIIELNGFNSQINVSLVNIDEISRESSSNFKGQVRILEIKNKKNITFILNLMSIDNKYLIINKTIKW